VLLAGACGEREAHAHPGPGLCNCRRKGKRDEELSGAHLCGLPEWRLRGQLRDVHS
ncbi:unnamed protein product, partial [Effrenium voratum]